MSEPENPEKLVPAEEYIVDGVSYYKVYEIEGQRYQVGLPPVEEIEGEDAVFDPNEDPEGWRIYADVIDYKQIAWLRHHPEHDFGHYVARWDEYHEESAVFGKEDQLSQYLASNRSTFNPQEVRELALSLPGAHERELGGHPAFFVERVFAIVWPQQEWVHVLLTVEMQRDLMAKAPHTYSPVPKTCKTDRWGESGATRVSLEHITREEMLAVLTMAHSLALPTELVFPGD